ncbi:hypothetical protein PV517_03035 [Streptomyces griseiscabiei]|uniref:Uncharacterized protein n=1 Tax=Streptomyces griseiscabiei TaxID=2993540 RepID=A0ABU4KWB5_9ACTN|nr:MULTISPECIES: hypothetical protein [Streptomyces]MDX2907671.1 hypothetical protein [Streptomyces griseiscabiei]
MRIRAKEARIVGVRCSSRIRAPAATATAGLTYVKTVARVGPTSRISSRKATKASAVQITPRATREIRADEEGSADGRVRAAAGA